MDTRESEKRSSDSAGFQDGPTTEDLEQVRFAISKCAFAGREHLLTKARTHFRRRNSREITEEELSNTFDSLRERIVDEDAAESSDEEWCDDVSKLHQDCIDAFQSAHELGKQHRQELQKKIQKLCEEEFAEESEHAIKAVFYNLEHQIYGQVSVEDEDADDTNTQYQPTEEEVAQAEAEQDYSSDKVEGFDAPNTCQITEEQVEEAVEKFCQETGRSPTDEEFQSLIDAFKTKLTDAPMSDDEDSDYRPEEEAHENEDDLSFLEEDHSIHHGDPEAEMEDAPIQEAPEHQESIAFQYMRELEQQSDAEEDAEEEIYQQPHVEISKAQQEAQEHQVNQICA